MVRTKLWLTFLFLVVLPQACTESNVLYKGTYSIPSGEWQYINKLEGTWTQDDTLSTMHVVLDIEHDPEFAYQNLYLTGEFQKNDKTIWKDTFSIQLAKPNSGKWLGRQKEDRMVVSDTISYSLNLNPGQELYYQFSQFSREEVLQGIEEVHVTILGN